MPGAITDLLTRVTDSNTGRPVITTLNGSKGIGAASISVSAATNWTLTTAIHFSIYTVTAAGVKDPTSQTDWKGTLSGTTISGLTITGGTDRAYNAGAIVEITPTAKWAKDLYDWGIAHANQDGSLKQTPVLAAIGTGGIATSHIADSAVTGAKIATYKVVRQDNTTTTTEQTARILTGWGIMGLGAVAAKVETVTFATPFTNKPIVIVTYGGDSIAGSTTYGASNTERSAFGYAYDITNSSFTARIQTQDAAIWGASTTTFYQWIAIGT